MTEERTELVEPTVELEETFLSMVEEYRRVGEDRYQKLPAASEGGFAAYVQRLRDQARGLNLKSGLVPSSTFWLVRDGRTILGVARLRHELNDHLLITGGHIGYDIRPSERRKGYGTRILELALNRARARGLTRVLVSCLLENIGSAKIIERNGGVLQDVIDSEPMGGRLKRYWIDL